MVDVWIHVTDAAFGLRRASKTKAIWTKKHCCVLYCRRVGKKNVTSYEYFGKYSYTRVLLIDGGAVQKQLATVRERTN